MPMETYFPCHIISRSPSYMFDGDMAMSETWLSATKASLSAAGSL